MNRQTKSDLLVEVKGLMHKLRYTTYDIEQHYEMLSLAKGRLSYLRAPDSEWVDEDIPMSVLRYCRDDLMDCLP